MLPALKGNKSRSNEVSSGSGYRNRFQMTPRTALLMVLILLVSGTLYLSGLPRDERARVYDPVGVFTIDPPFFDMHFILSSLDCARSGIPATRVCPAAGYYFIYPKTFYLLLSTGLSATDTLPAAIFVLAGFIVSMFAFLRSITWMECCYVAVLLCAPPTLLGLERCNIDLAMISLIAFAVLCLESRRWSGLALTAITLATLMKIYPIAAFSCAIGRVRRSHLVAAVLACFIGFGLQLDHLRFISNNVLWKFWLSWGYPVAFMRLRPWLASRGQAWLLPNGMERILQIAAPALCVYLAIRIMRRGCEPVLQMEDSAGMLAGASLYCFCWMFGPSYEYRYLVLILALPFLFHGGAKAFKTYAVITLAAMPPMFWLSLNYGSHLVPKLIQEALGLAVFCSLLTMLMVFVFQTMRQFQISELKQSTRDSERQKSNHARKRSVAR
jgi:hypothetical protein